MLKDTEEEESSNISFIGRDTQQLMIHRSTMMTLTLQNSSKSSIELPLWVDKRYKCTPNSSNNPHLPMLQSIQRTTTPTHSTLLSSHSPLPLQRCMQPPLRDPTSFPLLPLWSPLLHKSLYPHLTPAPPPPLTGAPPITCHTPSPQTPWRPTTTDIASNHGYATENLAFVVT